MASKAVVYADFNSPLCYLAGLWVDQRFTEGVATDWRAVEHAPGLSHLGLPSASAPPDLLREFEDAAELPIPEGDDELPGALPPVISNTEATVAACAEAVADGVYDELRRHLLQAIWIGKRHLSNAYEVRRIIAEVMYPHVPLGPYRSSELPQPLTGHLDPWKATRCQGGTIAFDGGPLTTVGYRRVRAWREQWWALGRPDLPALVDERSTLYTGRDAVLRLAGELMSPIAQGVRAGAPRGAAERILMSATQLS